MTREELNQALTDIGTVTDDAQRRQLVTQVTAAVNELNQNIDTLTQSNTKFETDMAQLQKYNMELYLQVQGQKKSDPIEKPEEKPVLKYEDLFDEKGEIK